MDAALGGRVVQELAIAEDAGLRAGVDDGAARLQVRQRRLGHVEVAVEVGLQRPVEMLEAEQVDLARVLLERGVVDQDVEPAQRLDGVLDRRRRERRVGDVALDQHGPAALAFDRVLGLLGVLVGVEVGDGDVGAFAGEEHRHGTADAGVGAGDQRGLAGELLGTLVIGRVVHRRRRHHRLDAGLFLVLGGERRLRIAPRAGLHGAGLAGGLERALLLGALGLALDRALLVDGARGALVWLFDRAAAHVTAPCKGLARANPPARRAGSLTIARGPRVGARYGRDQPCGAPLEWRE